MNIDYKNLEEITVRSQAELDDIPEDFEGRIYIEFGLPWDRAIVRKRYPRNVVARENSNVVARGNSNVVAWGNSNVVARGNSNVVARGNSNVEAWGNSNVVARENSNVVARENSNVEAWENSNVVAWENSNVVAWENSNVEARENSNVVANGNTQVVDRQYSGKIQIVGNARKVCMPRNIEEFMNFYGIEHTKTKAKFYKAVRKDENGVYRADRDRDFIYKVGKKKKEKCDDDVKEDCSYGIHISHLQWALNYGEDWSNLAILEVETKIADIVMPKDTNGKVRTSEVKVLREIPLEECGMYGKILARRRERDGNN